MDTKRIFKGRVLVFTLAAMAFITLQVYVNIRTNPAVVMAPAGNLLLLSLITFLGLYMLFYKINNYIEDAAETKKKLFKTEMENIILKKRIEELEKRHNSSDRSDTIDWRN